VVKGIGSGFGSATLSTSFVQLDVINSVKVLTVIFYLCPRSMAFIKLRIGLHICADTAPDPDPQHRVQIDVFNSEKVLFMRTSVAFIKLLIGLHIFADTGVWGCRISAATGSLSTSSVSCRTIQPGGPFPHFKGSVLRAGLGLC
jgi:hypothetical protein